MLVRNEEEKDISAVHALNTLVFETPAEANLVDALRKEARPVISLVAEDDKAVIGHILFSPVSLAAHPELKIMGLAPMAVIPRYQKKGVGSALVRVGLERCKELHFGAVVVLGHPEYYPRFGFSPSRYFGIKCEYQASENAFMAVELQQGYLEGKSGAIKYHTAFKNV